MVIAGNHSIAVPAGRWTEGAELLVMVRPQKAGLFR